MNPMPVVSSKFLILSIAWCLVGVSAARATDPVFDPALETLAGRLSSPMVDQFTTELAALATAEPACTDSVAMTALLRARRASGDYRGCVDLAHLCEAQLAAGTPGLDQILFAAGECAGNGQLGNYSEAYRLYDAATSPAYATSEGFKGRVYLFARFALYTQYSEQAAAILKRNPEWTDASIPLVLATLDLLRNGTTALAPIADAETKIKEWIASGDSVQKQALTVAWARHLIVNLYRYAEGARFLADAQLTIPSVDQWAYLAYRAHFHQVAPNFMLSSKIYEAYRTFTHPYSDFPLEDNGFTYTEITQNKCASSVLTGDALTQFTILRTAWLAGTLTTADALSQALALSAAQPAHADLLSFIGGLYESTGQDPLAESYYWQSHQACAYWDRSHWGLHGVHLRTADRAYDDYAATVASVDRELSRVSFPAAISHYVTNWSSLTPEAQKRFEYATRFWAPYISFMDQAGSQVYVKQAFQLLSEAPGLAGIRDTRIQMPSYENDNRLWDDVRGLGGQTVVVDWGEMMEAPFGAYNLAGHEIGHQFHAALPNGPASCITALYQGARTRKTFPDPYAGSNEREYFAQGVAYFMRPADGPKRFGLNVQWLIDNDPNLYAFLQNIQAAAGNVNAITCPVSIDGIVRGSSQLSAQRFFDRYGHLPPEPAR